MAILNTKDLMLVLGGATVFWLLGLVIWRRWLHPLAKYPGPFFHTVSNVPTVLGLLGGKHHIMIRKLHEKYGPVVRVSPNELSFCGANAWEDIYGFRTYDQPMEKDPIWIGALNAELESQPLTYARREEHSRQRRAFSHPFSNTSCIQQQPIIQAQVDKFIAKLTALAARNEVINLTNWFSFLSLDIIGDLCFAAPFGCLDDGKDTTWIDNLNDAKRYGVYEMATRRIGGPHTWLQKQLSYWLVPQRYKDGVKKHFLHSKEKAIARLQDTEKEHKDFIYYILRHNESKRLLTDTEILLNSSLFIGAGSDTTSSVLTSSVYILATHPQVYTTLAQEIRSACPTPADITIANIKSLPYLSAFISETMRMYTPLTTGMLRTVPTPLPRSAPLTSPSSPKVEAATATLHATAVGVPNVHETYIDSYGPIPPGTTVSAHHYTSTRSPLNWTRPQEFLPERWLYPEQFPHDKRHASQPFMLGPRGCIGKNLSHIEQRLVICNFLLHFDVELDGGCEEIGAPKWGRDKVTGDWTDILGFMAWEQPDLMVRLVKRDVPVVGTV
ncbi:Bcaba2 [Naviculisporaceae sp. PSN 640]